MIVEIKMIFIGTTKFTPKNRSGPVFFGCVDRKRPVLGGPVRSPQYLGRSWTGCGPRLRVLGTKNRTELDLKTLIIACLIFFALSSVSHHRCGHPLLLPCHVIIVCLSPSSSHGHCRMLSSMPKVAEGKGVTWQWLVGVTMAAGHHGY
jgi:hypothetical protein